VAKGGISCGHQREHQLAKTGYFLMPTDIASARREIAPRRMQSRRGNRQDRWADGRAQTVSWMSMNRIDQNPGRGSGSS